MGNALDPALVAYCGKGKTLYVMPDHPDLFLMVMSDRLSTHNVVHDSEIPGKGELIAAQTLFMLREVIEPTIPTHIVAAGKKIYDYLDPQEDPHLHYRSFVVWRSERPTVEYILRAYNAGSLYKAIQRDGTDPYGHGLSPDLPLMHRFEQPLFTPTRKSALDEPLAAASVSDAHPLESAMAHELFKKAEANLASRGITLIDMKVEICNGTMVDDWLNGDCARIAFSEEVRKGLEPPFLDKERFRKMAEARWRFGQRVPLTFSDREIDMGIAGYQAGLRAMTGGLSLPQFRRRYFDA